MPFDKIPVARKQDIIVQELKGEVLVYDLKIDKAFCLNETSAAVWQLCDGKKTVAEITESLAGQMKKPVNEDLVRLALDQLGDESLLDDNQNFKTNFTGVSRREAIRKVGLASLIALPLISSLVAPTAAHAASGGSAGVGQSCVNPKDCQACANGNRVQCRNNNAVCPTGVIKCCDCS